MEGILRTLRCTPLFFACAKIKDAPENSRVAGIYFNPAFLMLDFRKFFIIYTQYQELYSYMSYQYGMENMVSVSEAK